MLRMKILTGACFAVITALSMNAQAGPPGIEINGDIKITNGGTVIFPDGTMQATATLQGPQGPAGPEGAMGPVGPQGATGATGANSLISLSDSASGVDCPNGGTKIEVGTDQDRSGILEFAEIAQTKYVCNGSSSSSPASGSVTLTADPPTAYWSIDKPSFIRITAVVRNADGSPGSGAVTFSASDCMMSSPVYVNLTPGGIASMALGPAGLIYYPQTCLVYADYTDDTSIPSSRYSGSVLATFIPDSGTVTIPPTPVPPITLTATPSSIQAGFSSFINITAVVKKADGTANSGVVNFRTSSTNCFLGGGGAFYDQASIATNPGGVSSVAVGFGSSYGGVCIVYADFNDYTTSPPVTSGASVLATFLPPAI